MALTPNFAKATTALTRSTTGSGLERSVGSSRFDKRVTSQNDAGIIDPNVDNLWGGSGNDFQHPQQSYWDYYFSGQDIRVFVDGTEEDPQFRNLPIIELAFNEEQQKQPVYGFWSSTYDSVMRGTRIVSGAFSIATKYPNYMKNLLAKAAESRSRQESSYNYYRDLTEDDSNIQKYWGKTRDPAIANGYNLFSIHPPFSFVVVYGLQSISIDQNNLTGYNELLNQYNNNTPMYSDFNERLIETENDNETYRLVIEACELTNVQRNIGTDGSVIAETYSFFARDIIVPSANKVQVGDITRAGYTPSTLPDSGNGTSGSRTEFRQGWNRYVK